MIPEDSNLEKAIFDLKAARSLDEEHGSNIFAKYANGEFYSIEDRSDEDYLEGKIAAYDHAIELLERITNE